MKCTHTLTQVITQEDEAVLKVGLLQLKHLVLLLTT